VGGDLKRAFGEFSMKKTFARRLLLGLVLLANAALADEPVLNLYSSRHYQSDETLDRKSVV
jgi:acetoacetate decarboxylase